jgi:mono/diheme cytochrome c family protein
MRLWIVLGWLPIICVQVQAGEKSQVERGKEALLNHCYMPPLLSRAEYDNLWRVWGLKEKPAEFERQVRERYGLHEAPYPNHGLPMGLRETKGLFTLGVGNDCLMCHASTIAGKTVIGLGNPSLDLQGLFEDLALAQGVKVSRNVPFSNVRGTTEASPAAAFLIQYRTPELDLRPPVKLQYTTTACEDVPAWWLMKRKTTMYATGSHSSRSVRSLMAFLMTPFNGGEYIKAQEPAFRDIQAYMLSLEAPKYPFKIDARKAEAGKVLFEHNCARCHGTYGPDGNYPNKVIDLDVIGTDRTLATGFPAEAGTLYNRSWFGQEKGVDGKAKSHRGYQAPPLDGIWATAPYFHNGSVPTIYHVLNSKARPRIVTRSYRTGSDDYDTEKVGWKFTLLDGPADPKSSPAEQRKVYDTTQPGRGNTGHTFGDRLSETDRWALIEYLKTL